MQWNRGVGLLGAFGVMAACASEGPGEFDQPNDAGTPPPSTVVDGGALDAETPPPDAADADDGGTPPPPCTGPTCGLGDVRALAVGMGHSCAVTDDDGLVCWGWNLSGQLGVGDQTDRLRGNTVDVSDVRQATAGNNHTCVLHTNGSVRCWGGNENGQLGLADLSAKKTTPGEVMTGLSSVKKLASGALHVCALLENGTVRCWGRNYNGQLGLGTTSETPTPSPSEVPGLSNVIDLAANNAHTCALIEGGQIRCWGLDSSGQLGTGSYPPGGGVNVPTPSTVANLEDARKVSVGFSNTCAIDSQDRLWCWGQLTNGHDSPSPPALEPELVTGVSAPVSDVVASGYHTCALREGGQAFCWGMNLRGQLGTMACEGGTIDTGSTCNDSATPAPVLLEGIVELGSFFFHTCARTTDDTVHCWGGNWLAQLGDGTTQDRGMPGPVQFAGP